MDKRTKIGAKNKEIKVNGIAVMTIDKLTNYRWFTGQTFTGRGSGL